MHHAVSASGHRTAAASPASDADSEREMVASEPGDATPQEAARLPAPTLEILEFRNNVLLELCWLHFEDFLVSLGSDRRRYSGRLCAAKRAQWDQPADEVVHTVARQLDDTRAIFLRREFGYLQAALLRPVGRNDIQWILSTGGSFGPSQQQLLQRLGPLVYRTLAGFMDSQPMARVLARIVRDRALALWYHPTLLALPRDAGSFQRWYADFEFQQRANHAAMFCSGTLEAGGQNRYRLILSWRLRALTRALCAFLASPRTSPSPQRLPHRPGPRGEPFRGDHDGPLSGRPTLLFRQGCPGPKSRDTGSSTAFTWHSVLRSCVDVRVGGSCGRSPPKATPSSDPTPTMQAKSHDPLFRYVSGPQQSSPGTQLFAVSRMHAVQQVSRHPDPNHVVSSDQSLANLALRALNARPSRQMPRHPAM